MRVDTDIAGPPLTSTARTSTTVELPAGFALVVVARLASNVAFRLVYPFLPRISQGLGVGLGPMGVALGLRELTGLASPALGRGVDARGRSGALTLGLGGLAVAMVLSGASEGLVVFTVALVLTSLAKTAFDISSSAWVSDAVPFVRRGRALGILETTWALSFIIGMPLAALTIRAGTWRTPFLAMALVCGAIAVLVGPATRAPAAIRSEPPPITWTASLRGAIATMVLLGIGHQTLLVTFATWLEDEHGLSVSALGLSAIVIGGAELAGSGSLALAGDRIGKARGAEIALFLCVPLSATIPLGASSLAVALVLLASWFAVAEYAIVSMLTLFSELDPAARARVLGIGIAGWTIGHAIGSITATQIYEGRGMTWTAAYMAVAFAAAALVAHRWVFDPTDVDVAVPTGVS